MFAALSPERRIPKERNSAVRSGAALWGSANGHHGRLGEKSDGKKKEEKARSETGKGLYRSKYKDGEIFALSRRLCPPSPPSPQPASSFSRNLVNMHFSSLLLGLAATASAIDIRGHALDSCNGSYRACTNINPRVCCIFSEYVFQTLYRSQPTGASQPRAGRAAPAGSSEP